MQQMPENKTNNSLIRKINENSFKAFVEWKENCAKVFEFLHYAVL